MSDQPTANNQTDKAPPLPDLERDLDVVARDSAPPTAPEDSASQKMASDLEAVLDVQRQAREGWLVSNRRSSCRNGQKI